MLVLPTSTFSFARREAGGKGFNLYRMSRLGLPVPEFCVMGRRFFDRYLADSGLGPRLWALVAAFEDGRVTPEAVEARVREWMEATPLGEDLEAWVEQAYEALGDAEVISVRSSASDEDSAAHSFAGQLSSFLYVRGVEEAGQCLRRCWASGFSARGLHYRRERGLPAGGIAVAVIFQRMIDPDTSGVMFTCDPTTGDRTRHVISAVYGVGEGLVSGALDADTYRLDAATGDTREQQVVEKTEALRAGAAGACRREPVPEELRTRSCLDDAQLRALWELGCRVEDHLRAPQDLEWAIAGGRAY